MSDKMRIWRSDQWVRPYLRTYGKALALAIFLGVAATGFACGLMFTSGYMISLAAAVPFTVLALHVPSLFVRIFGIGKPLLRYGEKLTSHDWVLRMTSEMRRKLYLALDKHAARFDGRSSSTTLGSVLTLLNDDIGHVQNLIMRSILPLATAWTFALVVTIVCGVLSWQLACIMFAMLVLLAVVVPLYSAAANAARVASAKAAQAQVYDSLTDDVFGITDWVLSGRRDEYLERASKALASRDRSRSSINRFERRVGFVSQMLFCACIVAVLVWAYTAFGDGSNTQGLIGAIASASPDNASPYAANWIAAFILCLFPIMEALAPLPTAAMGFIEQREALDRLNRTLPDSEEPCAITATAATVSATSVPSFVPDTSPYIRLDDVSFAYPEGREVFAGLDVDIPYGRKVAITGRSGIGKTTLTELIRGKLRPTRGIVRIGNIEPSRYPNEMWRIVGVLHQQPKLFNMSLRDNLLVGNPEATDAQMISVIESVGLRERFDKLPHGLDSIVAENAFNFSGGEAHRIALARLLLADQPIIILDEPFASLDAETERETLQAVLEALKGRTVIAVTHSVATLSAFDRVISL